MNISAKDRERLRALAGRQAELSATDKNIALYKEWEKFGENKGSRPMIRIELGTFWQDVIPQMMECEGEDARRIERVFNGHYANHVLFEDDTLMPSHYSVTDRHGFVPFGLPVKREETGGVGHHFIPYLRDLEEDYDQLGDSTITIDTEGADKAVSELSDIFGDILPIRRICNCFGASPMQDIVHIMNMDDMFIAMYDEPELFHKMMERLSNDYIKMFKQIEATGRVISAAKDQHLNQGTYCFTSDLPDGKMGAALKDCWLYMDSQETSGMSPEMYAEFVFPYYEKIMAEFGLVSYGCCEATDPIWDNCLKRLPNLRKVSISPWCNEEFMGDVLRGTNTTYLRKPPANLLGVGAEMDIDAVKACFEATAKAARGCQLEIAQRDVYQINGPVEKVKQYVQIARSIVEK